MGVTTWLVIVACFCVLQGSLGSDRPRSRFPSIARMLRRLAGNDISLGSTTWTPGPTSHPTMNPNTPSPINFYEHWVECPVLESLLEQYFWDFPDTSFPKDSINISPMKIRRVFTKAVRAFDYLKNVRVTVDLLMEDLTRMILDQRVNCTTSMYQRIFVYYMRQRLDEMMSPRDSSLKSRIDFVLNQAFPNNPEILHHASELVWGVHYMVHESFINILGEEVFQNLGWFLQNYKWSIPSFLERFHRGEFSSVDQLTLEMQHDFNNFKTNFPDALRCITPQEFIELHTRVANWITSYYWRAYDSGLVFAFLNNHLQEIFDQKHNPSVNLDPAVVDDTIEKIINIILGYVNNTMTEVAAYEGYLASATLTPPTFMANSLTDFQWNRTMVLFNRMFGHMPTPNPTGHGLNTGDIAKYLQGDIDDLKKIQSLMSNVCTSTQDYNMVENMVKNLINEKENLINLPQGYYP